jgi:hypothetical protein
MLIIVPSVRAWRKIVMAVPKLSTLVPVERTYSMSGVVSVRRTSRSLSFVRMCLTDSLCRLQEGLAWATTRPLNSCYIMLFMRYKSRQNTIDTNQLQTQ